MKSFLAFILDALFPKKESIVQLESYRASDLRRLLKISPRTPQPWMRALFAYKNPTVRDYVWQIKYADNKALTQTAGELLAEEILSFIEDEAFSIGTGSILVAIPASKHHEKEKGFNQTDELCNVIASLVSPGMLRYIPNSLTKVRDTPAQASILNKRERMESLIHAFQVPPSVATELRGKNIILIDDVLTTGSTLTEARRALLEAGVKSVTGFTLAH